MYADDESQQVGVGGHGGFVEDHHGAVIEGEHAVIQPGDQRRDGARLDAGLGAERARRLPRCGRAEHGVPDAGERVGGGIQGGGLAGTGHADDHRHGPIGTADVLDGSALPVRQRTTEFGFLGVDGGRDDSSRHGLPFTFRELVDGVAMVCSVARTSAVA